MRNIIVISSDSEDEEEPVNQQVLPTLNQQLLPTLNQNVLPTLNRQVVPTIVFCSIPSYTSQNGVAQSAITVFPSHSKVNSVAPSLKNSLKDAQCNLNGVVPSLNNNKADVASSSQQNGVAQQLDYASLTTLPSYSTNNFVNNGNNELTEYSIQICDFCEEVFFNRYSSLVHNLQHIIIPLIKQDVYQCPECLFCFTSAMHIYSHCSKEHPHIPTNTIKYIVSAVENNKKVKIKNVNVNSNNYVKVNESQSNVENNNVRNRITFEDDDIFTNDNEFNDLTTNSHVNLKFFDTPWLHGKGKDLNGKNEEKSSDVIEIESNEIIPAQKEPIEEQKDDVYESVHYENLIKAGMYRCKRCRWIFPTKFELIRHEPSHMLMRRTRQARLCNVCDRFIGGSFMKHVRRYHPTRKQMHRTCKTCYHCGLRYYSHSRHIENYHNVYPCRLCDRRFLTENETNVHYQEHFVQGKCPCCDFVGTCAQVYAHELKVHGKSKSRMLKICQTCWLFYKNKQHIRYVERGEVSELGTRQLCDGCGQKFFEVKLIERIIREKPDKKYSERKKVSNEDRLKNIQRRLKFIKTLSKC